MMKWRARGLKWENGYVHVPCEHMNLDEKKVYSIEIKDRSNKRSLNANAYAWVLVGMLAHALGLSREEVYRSAIKQVGTCDTLLVDDSCVEDFIKRWGMRGDGWFAEPFKSAVGAQGKSVVMVYYGSSSYTPSEMAKLIDYLIFECKEQDIETMEQRYLDEMIAAWKGE